MKNNYRLILKGLLLLFLAVSAVYLPNAIMIYSGYCPKEKRYLTAKEHCDIVATEIINRRAQILLDDYTLNEAGEKIYSKRMISQHSYSNLDEFYALNPNACFYIDNFQREARSFSPTCSAKLTGKLNAILYVNYIFAFNELDNHAIYMSANFGLSNCGELLTDIDTIMLIDSAW